jgi:hypothetical protein
MYLLNEKTERGTVLCNGVYKYTYALFVFVRVERILCKQSFRAIAV